jgi:hypothetical protein
MLLVLLILAVVFPTAVVSNSETDLSQPDLADGWIPLFDGKSFDGWNAANLEVIPFDTWVIEDGCLKVVPNPERHVDLITASEFTDFELEFEWRIASEGNSGVKYLVRKGVRDPDRMRLRRNSIATAIVSFVLAAGVGGTLATGAFAYKGPVVRRRLTALFIIAVAGVVVSAAAALYFSQRGTNAVGPEYQVFDDSVIDGLTLNETAGALYDLYPPTQKASRPVGDFNNSRILLDGNRVEHWLNGIRVLVFELDSEDLVERVANSKFRHTPGFGVKASGHISLQNHGDEVWFRNLKIRQLND